MYSVVLATMLTVGGDAPSFGWGRGCHGCYGGCHGCYGAYNAFSCGGCYGCAGCYGCYGCGGCHGCSGFRVSFSFGCHGCYGCGGCYGCAGCFGGCAGCYACSGCAGCAGCYACSGCGGGVVIVGGCAGCAGAGGGAAPKNGGGKGMAPQTDAEKKAVEELLKKMRQKKGATSQEEGEVSTAANGSPATARITVRLPQDARLFVDNVPCPLTSDTRSFSTPALQPGREYYYTLRAEVVRDGQTRTQSQRVVVAPGRQVSVEFRDFAPALTAQR